jgi:hypothetical protein
VTPGCFGEVAAKGSVFAAAGAVGNGAVGNGAVGNGAVAAAAVAACLAAGALFYPRTTRATKVSVSSSVPSRLTLRSSAGRTAWTLSLKLDHRTRPRKGRAKNVKPRLLEWKKSTTSGKGAAGGWRLDSTVTAPTATVTARLTGQARSPVIRLRVSVTYKKRVYVRRERVEVRSACRSLAYLARDEKWVELGSGQVGPGQVGSGPSSPPVFHHVDRWTDKQVRVESATKGSRGGWSVVGAAGLSGMTVGLAPASSHANRAAASLPGSSGGRTCSVRLELDDSRNHPVFFASRCKRYWYPPAPRVSRSRRLRTPGKTVTYDILLAAAPMGRFQKSRFPHGYRSAVVFTDHADQAAPGPLRALLLGRSDATFARPAGGFVGNNLSLTKTLFFRGTPRGQLTNPAIRKLAKKAASRSIEIGSHSATAGTDSPKLTKKALRFFRRYKGATWIDHQPDTNCEAYSCRGWWPGSRYFIADILHELGFSYVWAGTDTKLAGGSINLLEPSRPKRRAPLFFPYSAAPNRKDDALLWLFRTVWMYVTPKTFARRLSPAALKKLASERGIFIGHTYLDAHHPRGHRRHELALIRKDPKSSAYYLHPKAEKVLKDLARFQKQKKVWVATMKALGDHLVGWDRVAVHPLPSGKIRIVNPTAKPIPGFTLEVKKIVSRALRAGSSTTPARKNENDQKQPVRLEKADGWTRVVVDLPKRSTVILQLLGPSGSPIDFGATP